MFRIESGFLPRKAVRTGCNHGYGTQIRAAHHGTWTWAQPHTDPGDGGLSWTELPLLAADAAAHPGDPVPHARAGYLLHPAVTDIPEQP